MLGREKPVLGPVWATRSQFNPGLTWTVLLMIAVGTRQPRQPGVLVLISPACEILLNLILPFRSFELLQQWGKYF